MSKITVEIQEAVDDSGQTVRALSLNGEVFDFGLDEDDLKKAKQFCGKDPFFTRSVHGDIRHYFLLSLSEIVGRELTIKEVNEAIEEGCFYVPD
jgi:hypothetical protein